MIDETLNNTDVKCILQKISGDTNLSDNKITLPANPANDNLFQKMLRKFNGTNAPSIAFKGENLGTNYLGQTRSFDNGNILEIVINTNNTSNLFNEATLIHELLHAFMLNDLKNWHMLQWDPATGVPTLAYNLPTICENNDFNSNIPEEHLAAVICMHIKKIMNLQTGEIHPYWMEEIFGLPYFDTQTYADALANFLHQNHDWNNETQGWQTNMANQFGFNWKYEVSEYATMTALMKTNYFHNWLNTKDIANFPLQVNDRYKNFPYYTQNFIPKGSFDLSVLIPAKDSCN
ncbi:hypothetical protein [Frigoriflavimonas asaccharolytica]|uniref:Uncharacterized protein n=1 Tax=Frigoriflavimonas asaccharolytica TaxID=2735899 RepID=A0A8J8K9R2_9FLAO|nr:hypothetical protein [Frigoriflavimonas asaccharolytica]NRS93931.1 hypothetical protein [Frigoriflavimonas asaccharolytica]